MDRYLLIESVQGSEPLGGKKERKELKVKNSKREWKGHYVLREIPRQEY